MFDVSEMDTNTMMMLALVVLVIGIVAVYYTDGLQTITSLLNFDAISSCKTE